jgi:S-adenosylmethionine hydrolase
MVKSNSQRFELTEGKMIILFTDFGWQGPYIGQLKSVLAREAPNETVIDLLHDAPVFNPKAASFLLNAFVEQFPLESVFLSVVDPGVGGNRRAVILHAAGRWFVGPDNGLFNTIAAHASNAKWFEITQVPDHLSATFHGRDLFAPVAAVLARTQSVEDVAAPCKPPNLTDWPEALMEIIYVDQFGNAMSGVRADSVSPAATLKIGDTLVPRKRTFSEVAAGELLCYENSVGYLEIARNQGNASELLDLRVGAPVKLG